MPNRDGTGPLGQGPLTGRGLGPCGCGMRRGLRQGFGRGFGRGMGRGRGFAWRARMTPLIYPEVLPIQQPAAITEKEEKQFLEQELTALKEEMKEIEERLKELKK